MQSSVWFKQALTYDINSSNNYFALICLKQSLLGVVFCLLQMWHQFIASCVGTTEKF